jgi:hypothetical protein
MSPSVPTALSTAKLKCHNQTKVVSVIELQFMCDMDESAPHVRLLAGALQQTLHNGLLLMVSDAFQ